MFPAPTTETARLALDTVLRKPTRGIPTWLVHLMEHAHIERVAGVGPGGYLRNPEQTYLACQRAIGVCLLDQYIWDNPLTMGAHGYEGATRGATTGAERIVLDGIEIDSADAVARHLQEVAFGRLEREAAEFDEERRVREIIAGEIAAQERLGPTMLKSGYAFVRFPGFDYGGYGYKPYFTAYARYPELMERHFALQADVALLHNRAAARAYVEGGLPPLYRLDHDMADSRGTLVHIKSLERIWFPHFARCLEPVLKAGVRLIWHCDGNLMEMVPRLLEVGLAGFQGFQYEDGMDYERICAMKTRQGEPLTIIGGVSVTRTLPFGTPADVRRELAWLVEHGPRTGLFLACSSSVTPGVPWENIAALVEGLAYYRARGRG
jgi:uroporphyrinogen decarboxylase